MSQRLQQDLHLSQAPETKSATFLSIVLTANRLQEAVRKKLKPYGLQPGPYNVLRILRGAGEEGLSCGSISDRLLDPTPDVTRLLARLESKGFIKRERDDGDKRSIKAFITTEGLAALAPIDNELSVLMESLLGHVPDDIQQQIVAGCDRVRNQDVS